MGKEFNGIFPPSLTSGGTRDGPSFPPPDRATAVQGKLLRESVHGPGLRSLRRPKRESLGENQKGKLECHCGRKGRSGPKGGAGRSVTKAKPAFPLVHTGKKGAKGGKGVRRGVLMQEVKPLKEENPRKELASLNGGGPSSAVLDPKRAKRPERGRADGLTIPLC